MEPGEINKIIPVQVAVPGDLQESLPLLPVWWNLWQKPLKSRRLPGGNREKK